MTLCEIATGNHYSIPLECQSFFSSGVSSQIPVNGGAKAGQCVEWVTECADEFNFDAPRYSALSRSAQFWSSYSGYLREMRACSPGICVICYLSTVIVLAQLCYAFRRWNEIGLFRYFRHGFVAEALFLCVSTADLAKNLYQNATLENINLIQLFSARERKFDDVVGSWKRDIQASYAIVISCHY